jgi:hypothetical protein
LNARHVSVQSGADVIAGTTLSFLTGTCDDFYLGGSMKSKIKHPKLSAQSQPELKDLAAGVGHFIEYWGFKAVQGRLWCYLYYL